MRNIRQRSSFKQDLKKATTGRYRHILDKGGIFDQVLWKLMNDEPLPFTYRDHALRNNLEGKRECHLRPDFLLIYWYEGDDLLVLDRLGTHSDLLGL